MPTGRNERKTEQLVRAHFLADPFPGLVIEEQHSDDTRINRALTKASKAGEGVGRPEFIVHSPEAPGLVVLVECKARAKDHESPAHNRPSAFAVDGALHYARFVSGVRDVVAIGVSGETARDLRVSTYRHLQGQPNAEILADANGAIEELAPFERLVNAVKFDPAKRAASRQALMTFSRDLHDKMRDEAKLTEQEKPLVVSGALIALHDKMFERGYSTLTADEMGQQLLEAIERELVRAKLPHAKVQHVVQPYSFIANHEWLNALIPGRTETPLQTYCADLAQHVLPYVRTYDDEDVVGHFYAEFLRYTGGDKKGLGIVLTPRHITELFCSLAGITLNDTVLDPCAGTGGYLISAMARMDAMAKGNAAKRKEIRERRLIGIEPQPMMFALAASNMLLRGDGKANLYQKSCFDPATQKEVTSGKHHPPPTKGMMNPPYSQRGEDLDELNFVEAMLAMLTPGGIGVAIVPMSCGIQPSPPKRRLMEQHTLLAAMSMPDQLFYPVSAVTCILVFRAHQPHEDADVDTWFGYWKDDGFRITRTQGRSDADHRWADIRVSWLRGYRDRAVVPGASVLRRVGPNDEWCAEAYMDTDYSVVTDAVVADAACRYALFVAGMSHGGTEATEDA